MLSNLFGLGPLLQDGLSTFTQFSLARSQQELDALRIAQAQAAAQTRASQDANNNNLQRLIITGGLVLAAAVVVRKTFK